MGWASGSYLANDLWNDIRKYVPQKDREKVAEKIYDAFCDADADDWNIDDQLIIDGKIAKKEGWEE